MSSDIEVAVVAKVVACVAGRGPILFSVSLHMVQFCRLTSWILVGDENRSSFVQGLLELRLDCSSGLANFSDMSSDYSTVADLQSGHRTSGFHEHKIALRSMRPLVC